MSDQNGDLEILEKFIVNNSDFEELESLLAQFNIFEALCAIRQEVRHSDFLSFLLNPQETHGLGDYFVRKFLQEVVSGVDYDQLLFTIIDLDIWDLADFKVKREWHSIDIILLSENLKLAVIIENKVFSNEHGDQLRRYYRIVNREYPTWRKLGVYLTPDGDIPSDVRYFPISYQLIATILEDIIQKRRSSLGPDVLTLIEHYVAMLRRHIVSGSRIEELCQKIYRKHQKALDMIYEYRPDLQSDIFSFLVEFIENNDSITLDYSTKSSIRFYPSSWSNSQVLTQGEGWTDSKHILIFEFRNSPDSLKLSLIIGPGDNQIRKKIYELVLTNNNLFTTRRRQLTPSYLTIFQYIFLTKKDFQKFSTINEVAPEIRRKWEIFNVNHFQNILSFIEQQDWIWDSDNVDI